MLKVIEEFPDYSITEDGHVYSNKSNKWMKRRIYEDSYWGINLRDGDSKNIFRTCHTLVAKAYLKDSWREGLIVNHIDLDKSNCHVSNLEWVTYKENSEHYVYHLPEDASSHRRKIPVDLIKEVCVLIQKGLTTPDINVITGVSKNQISKLRTGALYSWVSKDYKLQPEPTEKLTSGVVKDICDLLEEGLGCKVICDMYKDNPKITKTSVNNIKYRSTHEQISSDYTWWVGKYLSKSERRAGKTLND